MEPTEKDNADPGQQSPPPELLLSDELIELSNALIALSNDEEPDLALADSAGQVEVETSPASPPSIADEPFDLLSQENDIMAALPARHGKPGRRRRLFSSAPQAYGGGLAVDNQALLDGESTEESDFEEIEKAVRRSPPFLVSIILHMSVLIVLGLWMLYEPREDNIALLVTYSETEPDQLEDEPFELGTDENLEEPEIDPRSDLLTKEHQEIFTPTETIPEFDLLDLNPAGLPDTANNDFKPPQVGRLLKGRKPELRAVLLRKYGGTQQTEEAVNSSLDWLVRNQLEDGSWSLQGPYSNGGQTESNLAATGLALLALQGAGHTHDQETQTPHSKAVAKGWTWLLSQQEDKEQTGGDAHVSYAHAICTIAICELYAMTNDQKFRKPAQQAISYCLEAQGPNGGWRYAKGEQGDMSVTGWYMMALQSAKMGYLNVPDETLAKIESFLDSVQSENGRRYGYMDANIQPPSLTAEGLLCREYLGWKQNDARLLDGVDFLEKNPILWNQRNVYYWYYATQVLHHMEGEPWNRWNNVMREVLPANQLKEGPESGSWDPTGDRWGDVGGRLYVTCLHTYILEVYYRHLPIYNHTLGK